jgi:hypothetical protein
VSSPNADDNRSVCFALFLLAPGAGAFLLSGGGNFVEADTAIKHESRLNTNEHKSGTQEVQALTRLAKSELLNAITEEQKQLEAERLAVRLLARSEAEEVLAREAARKASVLQTQISAARFFGGLLILGGLAGMGYFFFAFNVGAPGTDVVNLGLMNTRMVGAIISGFVF